MKNVRLIVACSMVLSLFALDPRAAILTLTNKAKSTVDAVIQQGSKSIEIALRGRQYRAIREELLNNQKALQKVADEVIDSTDVVAWATQRAQLTILKATQDALVQKLRQQRFPLESLNKLTALLEAQFPALTQIFETLDARESILRGYNVLVDKVTMEGLNRDNPHRDQIVKPELATLLRSEEIAFGQARDQKALPVKNKFFASDKPRIAFVGTGGGYRAMMLTLGYLMGLEHEGWLDMISYVSSLSGSTWLLAPWIFSESDYLSDYFRVLHEKIGRNELNALDKESIVQGDVALILREIFWPKLVFVQPIGSVDIYGALLAKVLFSQFGSRRQSMHLSDQWELVKNGNKPFPLYTAISRNQDGRYDWIEFNPLTLTNLRHNVRIPSYAFGSQFRDGQSVIIAPEQSMGYLLGIFGSAYAVNIKDINSLFLHQAKGLITNMDAIKQAVLSKIFRGFTYTALGDIRAIPADNYNPFKGYSAVPEGLRNSTIMTLVDAGIDYNIPILPVLDPKREINVIIIGESSRNAVSKKDLFKMLQDVKRVYGYDYERIDDKQSINLMIYRAPQPKAPLILYVSYLDDPKLLAEAEKKQSLKELIERHNLATFNVAECMQKACSTFNFNYSLREFEQVVGIAQLSLRFHLTTIRQAIIDFFDKPILSIKKENTL